MMRTCAKVAVLLCCASTLVWGGPAILLTPVPTDTFNNGFGYSLGYEFNLSQAVTVDSLGFFTDTTLAESHQVGIYNNGGTLLVSATVLPGDPVVSDFQYHAVTPITLPAGLGYVIAGVTGVNDPYTFSPSLFSTDSRVQFVQSEFTVSNTLVDPSATDTFIGYFGPNFDIAAASAPEPGSLLLIGAGLTTLWCTRYRRKLPS